MLTRLRLYAMLVGLLGLLPLSAWAASLQYVKPGTSKTFADSAQSPTGATLTLTALASGTGQISGVYDKGAGAQPARWEIRCHFALNGANTVKQTVEIYVGMGDTATTMDGGFTAAGALATDKRANLTLAGLVQVDQTTTSVTMYGAGRVDIPQRYFQVGLWNGTALPFTTSTSAHGCVATPLPPEMQ